MKNFDSRRLVNTSWRQFTQLHPTVLHMLTSPKDFKRDEVNLDVEKP